MAESPTKASRRRFDILTSVAAVFFLLAVVLAAAPAFKAGAAAMAGVILLVGLAGVAFMGLAAFRGGPREAEASGHAELTALLSALPEAAAICAADGFVWASNAAWREGVGPGRRLPKGSAGLFTALSAARREGAGKGRMRLGASEQTLSATPFGADRFLLRVTPNDVPDAERPTKTPVAAVPTRLDGYSATAPFGAALIGPGDPFEARILEANPALTTIAGPGAVAGGRLADLITTASRADAAASLAAGREGPFEVLLSDRPDNTAHLYLTSTADGGSAAWLLDVTEQKKMQVQLAQRNKMEAIGQLAGGVAHDFNNLLSGINLRLDQLQMRHLLGDPTYDGLAEIRQTCVRAADLVRQLMTFSRQATLQREILDLGELLSDFDVLLRRLLREDVRLETQYGRNLPLVRADKAQLENAIMNLVVNARDAVHANGGGTVWVRTARVTGAEATAMGYAGGPCDELALIEVADDGPGMPPEVIGNIFEPFFTTKGVGEGTGLGLATVYGIVKQSDGWISVDSAPGQGARFRIFLPICERPLTLEQPGEPVRARPAARDLSGVGRILFVEDEDSVRGIAALLLRQRGYEVIEAADGEEALALAEQHAGQIDLMISDVIMPGMDGPTLLKRARGFLGAAPVMFISGYAEAEFSDVLEGEPRVSFLAKPLDIKTLAERVKGQLRAA
jgi:two-component system cell cycle sensor histidine kinase/response regulator CckA